MSEHLSCYLKIKRNTELANKLLSQEVIFKEDLELIFGKREWETNIPEETPESKEASSDLNEEEEKRCLQNLMIVWMTKQRHQNQRRILKMS